MTDKDMRSEQWWKHEVSNAWAEGYEKGRASVKQPEQEPVAWADKYPRRKRLQSYRRTTMTDLQDNVPDDSNLAQCEWCGWVVDWDEVPRARDLSGEIVTCCEECNEGESFVNYPSKKFNQGVV